MTKFLLDPKKLDESIDERATIGITGEAFAYFQDGENSQPSYTFYLKSVDQSADKLFRGLDIQRYDCHHGDLSIRFQRANLIFLPVSDGDRYQWRSSNKKFRDDYLNSCEALYVRGEFLKGNLKMITKLGVGIR